MKIGSYELETHSCKVCGSALYEDPKSTVLYRLDLIEAKDVVPGETVSRAVDRP